MTNDEFKRDREVIAEATEGPWGADVDYYVVTEDLCIAEAMQGSHDAQFIARARERWPAALEALELEKVHAKKLQRLLDEMRECHAIEWEARDTVEAERDRLKQEVEELKRKLNHEVYCRDKATSGRTKAERERDQLRAEVERLQRRDRCAFGGTHLVGLGCEHCNE